MHKIIRTNFCNFITDTTSTVLRHTSCSTVLYSEKTQKRKQYGTGTPPFKKINEDRTQSCGVLPVVQYYNSMVYTINYSV